MLIVCPSCASEYTIESARLGAKGRTVRCARCRDTWFAAVEEAPAPAEPVAAPASVSPARDFRHGWALVLGVLAAGLAASALLWAGRERVAQAARPLFPLAFLVPKPAPALAFEGVMAELIEDEGVPVLVVAGVLRNPTNGDAALAPLEILVRSEDERVLASWTKALSQEALPPGGAVRFEARLDSPPPDGREVRVHLSPGGIAVAALPDPQRATDDQHPPHPRSLR